MEILLVEMELQELSVRMNRVNTLSIISDLEIEQSLLAYLVMLLHSQLQVLLPLHILGLILHGLLLILQNMIILITKVGVLRLIKMLMLQGLELKLFRLILKLDSSELVLLQ